MTTITESLAARFEAVMQQRIRSNPEPAAARRVLNAKCLVEIGDAPFILALEQGRLVGCRRHNTLLATYDFSVRGSAEAWESLWCDPPAPGRQDLLALYKVGEVHLEGRLEPLMAHLQFFKDLLASPRAGGR
jgi:hypothetical protein